MWFDILRERKEERGRKNIHCREDGRKGKVERRRKVDEGQNDRREGGSKDKVAVSAYVLSCSLYTHTHSHTYAHAHPPTHTHTHTHPHTHTHTHHIPVQ